MTTASPAARPGANLNFANTDPEADFPFSVLQGYEYVLQFTTASEATAWLKQDKAKFASCHSFTAPNRGDSVPGGGTIQVTNVSVQKATVNRNQAFRATEMVALSEAPNIIYDENVLLTASGTNVYGVWEFAGVNDNIPSGLVSKLIQKVQGLYRHAKLRDPKQ